MKSLIIVLSLISAACMAASGALSLKGLPLGATEDQVREKYPNLKCAGESERRVCKLAENETENETVAGVKVTLMQYLFFDGKLASIQVGTPAKKFSQIVTALSDYYGSPASDRPKQSSTETGHKFTNRELIWDLPGGQISIEQIGRRADLSVTTYSSKEGIMHALRGVDATRKKASSDF